PAGAPAGQEMTIMLTQPSAGGAPSGPVPAAAHGVRIHPTAIIEPGVTIGPQTAIWDSVHVRGPSSIGRDCIIGEKSYIAYGVTIGDGVKINGHVHICTGVTIEAGVLIAAGVIFTNDRYPRAFDYQGGLPPSAPTADPLKSVVRTGATGRAGASSRRSSDDRLHSPASSVRARRTSARSFSNAATRSASSSENQRTASISRSRSPKRPPRLRMRKKRTRFQTRRGRPSASRRANQ